MSLRRVQQTRVLERSEGKELRTTLRFDATGRLAGHLVSLDRAVSIKDIGLGGFASEAPEPVAPGHKHFVRFTAPDRTSTVLETRSVYCRPSPVTEGSPPSYVTGFEFVRPPQDVDRAVRLMIEQVSSLRLR